VTCKGSHTLWQLGARRVVRQQYRKYKTNPVKCLVSPDFPLEGIVDGIELVPADHVQPNWFWLTDPVSYPEKKQ